MTFRVGILGGGNISATHARAAREIPDVEVAAVWGHNPTKAAALAAESGARPYEDLSEFLAHEGLDAVLIGSPSGSHAAHGVAAARHGLHVLTEKPVDVTTARCDELIQECDRAGVKLGVFFQDRAAPEIGWLKRLVEGGGLGKIFLVNARVKWYRPPEYYGGSRWRGTWELDGGGALMNQGVHTVDLLLWLLGDVSRLYARVGTAFHDIEVEDTAVACLEFAGGAVGTLEATTAAYPGYPRRVELTGSEGTVVLEHDRIVAVDLRTAPPEPLPREAANENAAASSPVVSDVRGHRRIIEDFIQAVRTGSRPLCDGVDGRRSVALIESVYRASREGAVVTLS